LKADPSKILFIGDSITDAFRKPREINPAFQLGNGFVLLIAAKLAARFPDRFAFINRGVSGDGIAEIEERWEADALAHQPDVLTLLVGVNETIRRHSGQGSISPAEFQQRYTALIETTWRLLPHCKLILMEPFLLETGSVDRQWMADLEPRQSAVAAIAQQCGAAFVPLQKHFREANHRAAASFWLYDGIHPTHAGMTIICEAWLQVAEPIVQQRDGTTI
jgi:lysophospholipase L1-like esterase